MKEKLEKIIVNNVKKIPVVNKIPGLGDVIGGVANKIGDIIDSYNSKKDKVKKLEEQHKKDMETVRKIEIVTKDSPRNEKEKIQKDRELKQYFDELLRGEQ